MFEANEADIDRITEAVHHLLSGRIPKPIELPADYPENEIKQLSGYVNRLITEYAGFATALFGLSNGDLNMPAPKGRMQIMQSYKNLHANLRHLTWKTQQIAKGDFTQSVDFLGEFSEAFNSMTRQLKEAFERIEEQNQRLAEANRIIQEEKEKSDRLLLNILPAKVAEELKNSGKTIPELFDNVTVCFSDLVGFTSLASSLSPGVLIEELNDIFTQFDSIIESNQCERIKTIGDAYLAVCGMPAPNPNHAVNIVRATREMRGWLDRRNATAAHVWRIRFGVHTGPVIGAVVGTKKYIYDVFGDTINTASRMESNSEPMKINLSEATYLHVRDCFSFSERPSLDVKGKGAMRMYFLDAE